MATFGGFSSQMLHVDFTTYTTHFPGLEAKQVAGGTMSLPGPPAPAINPDLLGTLAYAKTRTKHQTHTIVSVVDNEWHANRQAREKNEGAAPADGMGVGFDWFERIHVTPKSIDLGNVVSNVTETISLYSAYRYDNRVWTAFTNNAGAGITADNLPTLPKTIVKQTSFSLDVIITPSGPPTINGTLDFTFDVTTASVAITGTRIILYGFPPSGAVRETLAWLTDVVRASDGTEQRMAVRRYPRQTIEFEALLSRDFDRNEFNAFIFDWHARVFGVPLWWDARIITQDVAINDTAVTITSTDFADFRVGGLAVVIAYDADGNRTADTLEISAVTASPSQVTFTSGVSNAYTGMQALLIPVVPGVAQPTIDRSRLPAGQQRVTMRFLSMENDSRATADASGFLDWRGAPVVDDTNFMDNEIQEPFNQTLVRIDGDTGAIVQSSEEDRSTPHSAKRWNAESASRLWEIRGLLMALHGRQTSFFMPTFGKDFELAAAVSAGAATLDVTNIGYTQFTKNRQPFTTIVVRFKEQNSVTIPSPLPSGSPMMYTEGQLYAFFDITGSTEVSTTVERLGITPGSPVGFTADDVESIQYMIRSRFDSDTVNLVHKWTDLMGDAIDSQIDISTVGVYDE